jgi:hypothetical protein
MHYSLKKTRETRTVELPGGGTITYRVPTTQSFDACKALARKKRADLLADANELQQLGLTPEDIALPELSQSLFLGFLIGEIGARHVTAWTGVAADETGETPAEVTPDNVREFLMHPRASAVFYADFIGSMLPAEIKKKDLAGAATGTSAEAPPIAPDAMPKDSPAPRENPA